MLGKIFGNKKKSNNLAFNARASRKIPDPVKRGSRVVKIIHPGGHAEYYYMAIPASKIIEKYPSFILTRPEFFRRPWDTIIRPEEILVPGKKYYVVPCPTVKKLRRRIKRTGPGFSIESKSFDKLSLSGSKSGILVKPGPKIRTRNLHVRFFGIDTTNNQKSDSVSNCDKKNGKKAEKGTKERILKNPDQLMEEKKMRRVRNENTWEPSLDAINEQ